MYIALKASIGINDEVLVPDLSYTVANGKHDWCKAIFEKQIKKIY